MWPNLEDFIKHLNSWLFFLYNYFFMSVLFFDWERKYFVMQTGIIKSCSENLFFKLNSKNKTLKKKNQFLYIPYSKIFFRLKQISSQMQDFFLGSKAFFFFNSQYGQNSFYSMCGIFTICSGSVLSIIFSDN